ncbi:cyclin-dependent kinases regulatory subunit 1-like [Mercurialis annua]|uniref:cyclin-dependent kinases regulatory subunit 1-like n=1 Tax=Mercurialis annua TaxID=3986 RepID=UPI00215FC588|nr:cyclin-dependent kinases regulatory subunit 1-like [Mercurialis annua]
MGQIKYSEKYFDNTFEYRHVILPPKIAQRLPNNRLLSENEWRAVGVQQSHGWVHYAIHRPEPHILLLRRPLNHQQHENQDEQNILHCGISFLIPEMLLKFQNFKFIVHSCKQKLFCCFPFQHLRFVVSVSVQHSP